MHTPLRLRSLLAFAAALTLSRAQSSSLPAPSWDYQACSPRNGWLQFGLTSGDGDVVHEVGWVTTDAGDSNFFDIETTPDANRATFHWGDHCGIYEPQGYIQFGLYCTNCDGQTFDPSKDVFDPSYYYAADIVAFGFAADGLANQWALVNGGPDPAPLTRRESHVAQPRNDSDTVLSGWFTLDSNYFMHPTVLDSNNEYILEPLLNAGYLASGHNSAITFSEGTGPNGQYNVLQWVDMPN